MKRRTWSALAFFWLLTLGVRGEDPQVGEVSFRYDPAPPVYLTEDAVRSVARIQPESAYSPEAVQDAIRNLYALGVFHQVEVYTREVGGRVQVQFRLEPFPKIENIHFKGNYSIKRKEIVKILPVREGDPSDPARMATCPDLVRQHYAELGFFQTRCTVRELEEGRVRSLELAVQEGPRARVVNASAHLLQGVYLPETDRLLTALQYRPYVRDQLDRTARNIQNLYRRAGFIAAEVAHLVLQQDVRESATPVFLLKTGPRVTVRVQGAQLTDDDLRQNLGIYRLANLSRFAEELSRDDLREILARRGVLAGKVESIRRESPDGAEMEIVFQVSEARFFSHFRLILTGNAAFSRAELLKATRLTEGQGLTAADPSAEAEKLRQFYVRQGYLEAQCQGSATTAETSTGGEFTLSLTVTENARFRVGPVSVEIDRPVDFSPLQARLQAFREVVYTADAIQEIRAAITDFLASQGWSVNAVKQQEKPSEGLANPTFACAVTGPQHLDNVVLVGHLRTRPDTLSRLIGVKPDTPLDSGRLYHAEGNLLSAGLMDSVNMSVLPVYGREGHANLLFRLREAPRHTLFYGFGYQEWEGPRGMVQLENTNFRGRGQTVGALIRGSRRKALLQLSFHDDKLLLGRYPVDLSAYFDFQDRESFKSQKISLAARTLRRLTPKTNLAFQLAYERITNYDVVGEIGDIPRDEVPVTITSLTSTLMRDTRDNFVDPSHGTVSTLEFTAAPRVVGDDTGYLKFFFQQQYYRRILKPVVLAASFRFGGIHNLNPGDTPISEKFFAGGSTTLRGFSQDEAGPLNPTTHDPLGGDGLLIGNVELRFPVWSIFDGVVFYDTGNVFETVGAMAWKNFSHTVGLGIRLRTPLGPVRFDIGYNLKEMPYTKGVHYFVTFGNPF